MGKKWKIVVCVSLVLLILIMAAGEAVSSTTAILIGGEEEEQRGGQATSIAMAENSPLSEKVEGYRDDVLAELKKYGKEAYINLLLAVMEQESHGEGNDVFQASESKGLPCNTLSVSESIKQGVAYLSGMLDKAKVDSPEDLERIRLALQGYNMSGGYIDYAIKKDGKWTQENVFAYAKEKSGGIRNTGIRAKNLGPWRYGDQYYTTHVLRYYQMDSSNVSGDETEATKVALDDRMNWLFPNGTPASPEQMKPYLTQITVPILNSKGKETTMILTVHKKLTANIKAAFEDMKKLGFKILPGETAGYTWRTMASNRSKISYHSYGCVVDINWTHNGASYTSWPYNPGKDEYSVTDKVVTIWKKHGFYWGGDWSKAYFDPMHFTYVNH